MNNDIRHEEVDEVTAMLRELSAAANAPQSQEEEDAELEKMLAELDAAGADDSTEVMASDIVQEVEAKRFGDLTETIANVEKQHAPVQIIEKEEKEEKEENITESVSCADELNDSVTVSEHESATLQDTPSVQTEPVRTKTRPPRFTLADKNQEYFNSVGLEQSAFEAALENAPKKAKDKIRNVMNWFSCGGSLSVYTEIAMRHILDSKQVTSNSVKMAFMSNPGRPYPLNTASTQAGQIMAIFPAVGIATKNGGTLTLNEMSPVVKKFRMEYQMN